MSPTIIAIDPGPERSAWLIWCADHPVTFGIHDNAWLLDTLNVGHVRLGNLPIIWDRVVIERVEGFGMAVGAEVFETCVWTGRFWEAANMPVDRITRKAVKLHLCGTHRAKDPNVRQALIDRFGGPTSIRKGGQLYGVSKDVWSALAIAVAYSDGVR